MVATRSGNEEMRMAIHLPGPIEVYFEADTARNADALATCFAADATVHDEDRTPEGLVAITAWKIATRRKYEYTVEPLEAAQRDGRTVVAAGVSGNFPGSPVTLTFIFRLKGENIASLEICP
jgi:hypothetical protein